MIIMENTFLKSSLIVVAVAVMSGLLAVDAVDQHPHSFAKTFAFLPRTIAAPPAALFLSSTTSFVLDVRGGESSTTSEHAAATHVTATPSSEEPSLDEKVYAAMKKLGISPPTGKDEENNDSSSQVQCKDGLCPLPEEQTATSSEDPTEMAHRLAKEMNVDPRLSMAAIGATSTMGGGDDENQRIFNESAARNMIQQELDLISSIPSDSDEIKTLTEEGFDSFLARRALAFAENNLEDARAILLADQMDEEEEEQQQRRSQEPDFVEVKASFDPTKLPTTTTTPAAAASASTGSSATSGGAPKPAPKESVVFEATTAQIQELVLESPVPVLLDVYADW
jgi:hypothetical protein